MGTARVDIELRFADALLISADGVSTTQVLRRQGQPGKTGPALPRHHTDRAADGSGQWGPGGGRQGLRSQRLILHPPLIASPF